MSDYYVILNYIRVAAQVLFSENDGKRESAALTVALKNEKNQEFIRNFITESQVGILCVQRNSSKDEEEKEQVTYKIGNKINHANSKVSSVVIIKRGDVIKTGECIDSQVRVINFNVKKSEHAHGNKMAPSVEITIAELKGSLLNLQQDIPEITLTIHPIVADVIKQCANEGRKPNLDDFGDKLQDSSFLNALHDDVNCWTRAIQEVTKLDRDPSSSTASEEINFWLNLEKSLHHIQEQTKSIEVALILKILKHGKRFYAIASFDEDSGLQKALATVNDHNTLMKKFPIKYLLAATELESIDAAIKFIFGHLSKIKTAKYPLQRFCSLLESIYRDWKGKLLEVLGSKRLLHIPFENFQNVEVQYLKVISTWENEYEKLIRLFKNVDVGVDKFIFLKLSSQHKKLRSRMEHIGKFRKQLYQIGFIFIQLLRCRVRKVNDGGGDASGYFPSDACLAHAMKEINLINENVKKIDCFDVSQQGQDAWDEAMQRYEEFVDGVEKRIVTHLTYKLETAKSVEEIFRTFSCCNSLFVRPHIRNAIKKYQNLCVQHLKVDIQTLYEKFKFQFHQSNSSKISKVRDLPPVAGLIIWTKQIDRQLLTYFSKVKYVLGENWEHHMEGHELKVLCDNFHLKLKTQKIYDDWVEDINQRDFGLNAPIFTIEVISCTVRIKVNFLPEINTLVKEVRNLKNLGFKVPIRIFEKAYVANEFYPHAISLIQSIRTYEIILEKIEDRASIIPLLTDVWKKVQQLITEGVELNWYSFKLKSYSQILSDTIVNFQRRIEELSIIEEQLQLDVRSLETCPYSAKTFSDILAKIQNTIDDLSFKQYSNLDMWVRKLSENVEEKLATRLQAGIQAWTDALIGVKREDESTHIPSGDPKIQIVILELNIINETPYLDPCIEETQWEIMQQMFAWRAIVTSQQRLQSTRYLVSVDKPPTETYRNILIKLATVSTSLENASSAIKQIIKEVQEYVNKWFTCRLHWEQSTDGLGEDIGKWITFLNDIKKSRSTFDACDTRKEFGPIIVDFAKERSKLLLKYDSWHKEILGTFGILLNNAMTSFHAQVSKSDLEMEGIEISSDSFQKQVEIYREGQDILKKEGFQFPSNWFHVENFEDVCGTFNTIQLIQDNTNNNLASPKEIIQSSKDVLASFKTREVQEVKNNFCSRLNVRGQNKILLFVILSQIILIPFFFSYSKI